MTFHPAPADADALVAYAQRQHRVSFPGRHRMNTSRRGTSAKALISECFFFSMRTRLQESELMPIEGVVGAEFSKYQRKKK
jgi:hypothetical protein